MNNKNDQVTAGMASKAVQLPDGVQFAITTVLPNCVNGAFWGFTSAQEIGKNIVAIKKDNNIKARKLGNACLIEVNPDYLYKACNMVDAGLMTQADVAIMQKYMAEAEASFEKFLYTRGERGNFAGLVGIYSINDSDAITYKNVSYPAFRLNIRTVLQLCNKWGYAVLVNGQFTDASTAASMGGALFESMQLSPTNTGVFITIKSCYSPEQIKRLKVEYGFAKPPKTTKK